MTWVDVRCQHCGKLLLEVSGDLRGLVRAKCRHCKRLNFFSLAVTLTTVTEKPDILRFPKRAPV